jgi:hypothetical protein
MAKRIKSVNDLPTDFKIIHVMADGTVLDSIKGIVIPYTQETRGIYEMIAKYA